MFYQSIMVCVWRVWSCSPDIGKTHVDLCKSFFPEGWGVKPCCSPRASYGTLHYKLLWVLLCQKLSSLQYWLRHTWCKRLMYAFFFWSFTNHKFVKFWLYDTLYREDRDYCKGFSFIGMSLRWLHYAQILNLIPSLRNKDISDGFHDCPCSIRLYVKS